MGTATGPEDWRTGPTDLLTELYTRAQLAQSQLGNLFSGQKKYFYKTSEAIINEFGLPSEKADALRGFTETLASLLDMAYPQAETKLQKLLKALESNSVKVELGPRAKKTLHITPEGEEWYVKAYRQSEKPWIFSLPLYKVGTEAKFPDLLNLSNLDLFYLCAGWRASDESSDKGKPEMLTTQPWQLIAWSTVRYGYLQIYLKALNLNMNEPTLAWIITSKSWNQQWPTREGKNIAKKEAEQHPLGLLAWYLGDGKKHRNTFRFAIKNDEKSMPIRLVQQILQAAYQTGYGRLLDLLNSEKWQALKRLQPKQDPVYAELKDHVFWLVYKERRNRFVAQTYFKNIELARTYLNNIKNIVNGYLYKTKDGYAVEFSMSAVLKLAEQYQEWRKALKELAQKYNIQPETPSLRRLLELAENPAPPQQRKIYY